VTEARYGYYVILGIIGDSTIRYGIGDLSQEEGVELVV